VDFRAIGPVVQARVQETVDVVYVGAGGSIMAKSFSTICAGLAEVRRTEPALVARVKIRLFGTYAYWQNGDPKPLQEIADRFGLTDIVEETPPRITYLQSMELVRQSNGLLILGVDDRAYMPSKLFTYALSGKPLLCCFHAESPPVHLFRQTPELGNLLTFDCQDDSLTSESVARVRTFLTEIGQGSQFDRQSLIKDYLAPAMAGRHVALFERICNDRVMGHDPVWTSDRQP
jgi:hypothetical protein